MANPRTTHTFLTSFTAELRAIPRKGLVCAGAVGLGSAGFDLFHWSHGGSFIPPDYAVLLILLAGWLLTAYGLSMRLVATPASWRGLAKFLATTLVLVSPILLALLTLRFAKSFEGQYGFLLALVLALLGSVVLTLLPGWPILQAVSTRLVGPIAALKATKGVRRSLILGPVLTGGLNKFAPETSTAHDLASACLLATLNGLLASVNLLLAVAIAVVAWRHMASRISSGDPACL
jgi:hypothetical protein